MNDTKRTKIFINIIIVCIASSMLATALTTALLPICKDIDVSVSIGQWLTSGYSLIMGIIMPLTAFLMTRFKTKKLYITGILIFIIGLIICAISPNFTIMMLGRILQACGNGILTSMAQVILLTIYPIEKRGSIMGWYGLSVGAAPVIAPTLAGILVDTLGWRYIFYISILIMVVALIFAFRVFENVIENTNKSFDVVSFILSAFAFGGLTLGIGNIGTYTFNNPATYIPLIIGIITGIIFTYRQLNMNSPFLDLKILKIRDYALSVIGSMILYFVMMGSSIIIPLYVQSIKGFSATTSGMVTLPGSLAMTIVSPFAGRIFDKLGIKKLFIFGASFMLLSNLGMYFITMNTPVYIVAFYNVIRSVAIGCLMMPLVTWGNGRIKQELVADGTAILASLRTVAGAIGSAVFVGIMTFVAKKSELTYGSVAQIHGLNITFLCMTLSTVILLGVAVFFVKEKNSIEEVKEIQFE